jgi:hypothetical protein
MPMLPASSDVSIFQGSTSRVITSQSVSVRDQQDRVVGLNEEIRSCVSVVVASIRSAWGQGSSSGEAEWTVRENVICQGLSRKGMTSRRVAIFGTNGLTPTNDT